MKDSGLSRGKARAEGTSIEVAGVSIICHVALMLRNITAPCSTLIPKMLVEYTYLLKAT